ncbi:uncharacterized protein LOC117606201 [Osmia lignaria lignaria]|uniref:uncharacterized protein LOC117606201 n=1 Tax=Osmia lignaria lignaria TaxID=1437193 RepID=UPI0014797B80|nr:uncharacterized protein LOC117606201 [Osmia lignaria]
MVRKSFLVYELLRTEQPQDGFSEKEIVEQISNKHDIMAGKGLRRQVAVALRRGLDFGILAKKNNKFRFDPDNAKTTIMKRRTTLRKSRSKKKKKNNKRAAKTKRSNTKSGKKSGTKQNQNRSVPPPRLPKTWVPNRRNLADEPLSKVKKI